MNQDKIKKKLREIGNKLNLSIAYISHPFVDFSLSKNSQVLSIILHPDLTISSLSQITYYLQQYKTDDCSTNSIHYLLITKTKNISSMIQQMLQKHNILYSLVDFKNIEKIITNCFI